MEKVRFSQCREGRQELSINADRLYTGVGENSLRMEKVEAVFFARNDTAALPRQAHVSGLLAYYDMIERVLTLSKNVTLEFGDDYVLRTKRLRYFDKAGRIKTKAAVHLQGHNLEIKGKGLVYDIASGDYTIGGRVYCRIW